MKISAAFPSTYLKAADLQGQSVNVRMDRVIMEDLGSEEKPVLYFQGAHKGLVLNKTNANTIAAMYGDDTSAWTGQPVTLVEAMVDFQGRTVAAIRVRVQSQVAKTAKTQFRTPPPLATNSVFPGDTPLPSSAATSFDTPLDDEIPF